MALLNVLFSLVWTHGAVGACAQISTAHSACHVMVLPSDVKADTSTPWHAVRGGLDRRVKRVNDYRPGRGCHICALSERHLLRQLIILKRFSIDNGHAKVYLLGHLLELLRLSIKVIRCAMLFHLVAATDRI